MTSLILFCRNAEDCTAFMQAVVMRAYPAAVHLFTVIRSLPDCQQSANFRAMIYPEGSRADDSPLHVCVYNDTCSFTWTGDEHINQDIFECRTCGLLDSLCCCTECAHVCHKGHDCK